MLRQTVKTQEIKRLVDVCYTRYREGFVTNGQKGDVPSRYQSLATYLAKYVVSPPISLRRIDRSDGPRVTYHSQSHRSERVEQETVEVYTCIGRMVQHTFPKGFQRIRSYGVQATTTFATLKRLMQEALAKVKGIVKGAINIIAPMTYRQRYQQSTGRDPLRCPHCQSAMEVWRLWHPLYGVIHDELQAIRRGKYAAQTSRADPAGRPGRTVRPAAGGISLSLPGLR
jgi:Putative transposase